MFVRFSCGCVGLIVGPAALVEDPILERDDVILIDACDRDHYDNPYQFNLGFREPAGKSFAPLNFDEIKTLADSLHGLIADGHRFREVKSLLNQGGK